MAPSFLDGSHAYTPLRVHLKSVALKLTREHVQMVRCSRNTARSSLFWLSSTFPSCFLLNFRAKLRRRTLEGYGTADIARWYHVLVKVK